MFFRKKLSKNVFQKWRLGRKKSHSSLHKSYLKIVNCITELKRKPTIKSLQEKLQNISESVKNRMRLPTDLGTSNNLLCITNRLIFNRRIFFLFQADGTFFQVLKGRHSLKRERESRRWNYAPSLKVLNELEVFYSHISLESAYREFWEEFWDIISFKYYGDCFGELTENDRIYRVVMYCVLRLGKLTTRSVSQHSLVFNTFWTKFS